MCVGHIGDVADIDARHDPVGRRLRFIKKGTGHRAGELAATPASASPTDRMKALNDLRDQKLITPEEYETRRKAILNDL